MACDDVEVRKKKGNLSPNPCMLAEDSYCSSKEIAKIVSNFLFGQCKRGGTAPFLIDNIDQLGQAQSLLV